MGVSGSNFPNKSNPVIQALALLVGQNGSTFRQALEALVIT
jgi:hypothetical protein